MPQAERQRRWYLNLTEEQREARRAKQRGEGCRERNARRVFAGAYYVLMANSVEQAEVLAANAADLLYEYRMKQAVEQEIFNEELEKVVQSDTLFEQVAKQYGLL